uniref:Putative tick cistatins 1 n=1 Tax=Amblyomma cajennense TaxID=34607 RepID=A0A023FQZ4_AMBCJ
MASPFVLVTILLAAFVCRGTAQGTRLVGGWEKKTVEGNELFKELAHFAVGQQVGDREFFDTVVEVTDAETQLVAGTNYRLTFKIAESTCRVTETYTKELCRPKTEEVSTAAKF